jgi:hypothetical protein
MTSLSARIKTTVIAFFDMSMPIQDFAAGRSVRKLCVSWRLWHSQLELWRDRITEVERPTVKPQIFFRVRHYGDRYTSRFHHWWRWPILILRNWLVIIAFSGGPIWNES